MNDIPLCNFPPFKSKLITLKNLISEFQDILVFNPRAKLEVTWLINPLFLIQTSEFSFPKNIFTTIPSNHAFIPHCKLHYLHSKNKLCFIKHPSHPSIISKWIPLNPRHVLKIALNPHKVSSWASKLIAMIIKKSNIKLLHVTKVLKNINYPPRTAKSLKFFTKPDSSLNFLKYPEPAVHWIQVFFKYPYLTDLWFWKFSNTQNQRFFDSEFFKYFGLVCYLYHT
jgi:hypothetical protein